MSVETPASTTPPRPRAPSHRAVGRRRPRVWLLLVAVALAVVAVLGTLRIVSHCPAGGPGATRTAAAPLPFRSAPVTVTGDTWDSWALMDNRTGQIWGSSTMDQSSWTASMIKVWLGADYLRRAQAARQTPGADILHTIEVMIRDSDNDAATEIYNLNGQTASIERLISICGLTDSASSPDGWGATSLSARDSVRMGECVASGKGAGAQWTDWLLTQMRGVRGEGNFGIRNALPPPQAATVAIKNGYADLSADGGLFYVDCLAIGSDWTMAVMQQYQPKDGWAPDLAHGAQVCTDVAAQLLAAATGPPSIVK